MTKEEFLKSMLCKSIKDFYIKSCYTAKGYYPTINKIDLYLDRAYYYLNKDNLLVDFVTAQNRLQIAQN